jgi:Pyrroline-5-carboxylate reductase dimerisation
MSQRTERVGPNGGIDDRHYWRRGLDGRCDRSLAAQNRLHRSSFSDVVRAVRSSRNDSCAMAGCCMDLEQPGAGAAFRRCRTFRASAAVSGRTDRCPLPVGHVCHGGSFRQHNRKANGSERRIRAIPNAAAQIGRSYTPCFAGQGVTEADKTFVQNFFEPCGAADEVPCEADTDYLSGLTGSGPAFPALLADALLSHAQLRGLPASIARNGVEGVIAGASYLVAVDNRSPGEILRTFMDYRGTTAAALQKMIGEGFADAVHAGLEAAEAAAIEMSRSGSTKA